MRSQSIQSLQDTTSLYASQIDTAHISINRYLIRLLTENDDADTLLETQDKLEFISSAERVHNNIDIFLESFEKGYQIFLYNSENERMYRPTEIFQTLTQNQLVLLNKHLIQKITAAQNKFLHGCLGSTNVRKERIFLQILSYRLPLRLLFYSC